VQHRNNTICNDVAPSCNGTFVALSLVIDVSRTPDNAAIATELRGALQHHPQRFSLDFCPMFVGFSSDCPASLTVEVLLTSLLMSLLTSMFTSLYCRPTPVVRALSSYVLSYYSLVSCVLRTMVVHPVVLCHVAYLVAF